MRSVRMRGTVLLAGLLLALPLSAAAAPAPTAVAVFDVELYDTSLEGELRGRDPAESARLGQITALLREAVETRPDMVVIDVAPLRERLAALPALRSEEHTSALQSLMRISYAVFCLKKKRTKLTCK